jgi:predicted permease
VVRAGIPVFFVATLAASALAGAVVARVFSEPVNRRLRRDMLG